MKKKTKELTINNSIKENVTALVEQDKLSPDLMAKLEENLPDYLKEYEADGTAIMRWNYEYLILLEYVLEKNLGISKKEFEKIEKDIILLLQDITHVKAETPRLMTKQDFHLVMKNVERNKLMYKAQKAGIFLPSGKKLIKK